MSNFPSLGHALFAAVAGGALRLCGLVEMWNVSFERNSASSEGAAISNIGHIINMSIVLFNDNYFSCNIGEFLEYLDVEVSIRVLMDISTFPKNHIRFLRGYFAIAHTLKSVARSHFQAT